MERCFQEVECISSRENPSYMDPVIGTRYYLELTSVYLDNDGDAYGIILTAPDKSGYPLGYKLLKHFKTIM